MRIYGSTSSFPLGNLSAQDLNDGNLQRRHAQEASLSPPVGRPPLSLHRHSDRPDPTHERRCGRLGD